MRSLPLNWFRRSAVSAQWWGWVPTSMGSYLRMRALCVHACVRLWCAHACMCGRPRVCMGARVRAWVHVYVCDSRHVCVCGCVAACVSVRLHAWPPACVSGCLSACVHGCLCVWVPACLHACVFSHVSVFNCSLPGILQRA